MSEYREQLQNMMLDRSVGVMELTPSLTHSPTPSLTHSLTHPLTRFYTVCEYAAYAVMTAGWVLCIVCHI